MVAFNPETPVNQVPDYLRSSKPAEVSDFKSVGGVIAKGLGDIVSSAATGADTVVKSMIDNALYTSVDRERDQLTGALELATGIPEQDRVGITGETAMSAQPSLTAAPAVPQAVENSLSRADRINSAKLQNLDLSAHYQSRLINEARNLRSTYGEGYRPYIDQRMAEIAGGNPANAYVQRLMQTYIEQQKGQGDNKEKINAYIRQHSTDVPDMERIYRDYNSGKIDEFAVIEHVAKNKAPAIQMERDMKTDQWKTSSRTQRTALANDSLDAAFDKEFDASLTNILGATGYNIQEAQNIAERIASGEVIPGMDNTKLQVVGQAVLAAKENVRQRMLRLAREDYSGKGESAQSLVGREAVEGKINQRLSFYDHVGKMFLDEKAGAAFSTTNAVAAYLRNKESQLYLSLGSQDQVLANYIAIQTVLAKNGGLGAEALVRALGPATSVPKLSERMTNFLKLGPIPNISTMNTDPAKPPITIKEYVEKLQKHGSKDPDVPGAVLATMSLPQVLLNPNLPDWQKLSVIRGSFSPENVGNIQQVKDDYINSDGQAVTGQHTIFAQNTNKKIVDEIWRLSQGNRQLWDSAKIWIDKERETMVGNDVRQLNVYAANPNIKFTYDTDSYKFRAETTKRTQSLIDERGVGFEDMTFKANRILKKINDLLPSIVYVAQKEGTDPNAAIYRTLLGMGLDPDIASVGKMLSAMKSATTVQDPFNTKSKDKNQDRVPQ